MFLGGFPNKFRYFNYIYRIENRRIYSELRRVSFKTKKIKIHDMTKFDPIFLGPPPLKSEFL